MNEYESNCEHECVLDAEEELLCEHPCASWRMIILLLLNHITETRFPASGMECPDTSMLRHPYISPCDGAIDHTPCLSCGNALIFVLTLSASA